MATRTLWRWINLTLTATMVGNELGGWLAMHPALMRLPTAAHIQAEQAIVRRYLWVMPFWMGAAIASYGPVLKLDPNRHTWSFRATRTSLVCLLAMLGVTFIGNMPINRRVIQLQADHSPGAWLELRERWDRWHTLRNMLNLTALALLGSGVGSDRYSQEDD